MQLLRRYIGTKAFYKEIFVVATPIALQLLITALVNTLDTFMIANYGGTTATAGVAIANRFFNTFNMIIMVMAFSCSVFIAQYFGAKQNHRVKQIFGISIILTFLAALIALLLALIFNDSIIHIFTSNFDTFLSGSVYLRIVAFSFIPYAFSAAMTSTLRPLKMTKIPLYSAILAAISNALLNYILIYGKLGFSPMGVQGAAIATIISRVLEALFLLVYFLKVKPLFHGTFFEIFKMPKVLIIDILRRLRPLFFAQILTEAMNIFMLFAYARIDLANPTNVAAITISTQILEIVFVLAGGMGTAAAVLVGSRLGANLLDEAREHARWQITYAVGIGIFASSLMIISVPFVAQVFQFHGAEQTLLRTVMILQAITLPMMIYSLNVIFITRAGGYTVAPLYINNFIYYAIKLPIIVLFVFVVPNLFEQSLWIQQGMVNIGLMPLFVIFVFLIDRMCEILRLIVAAVVYRKADWCKNITRNI